MDYPQHVQEPLQQLVAATDAAGRQLGAAGRQAVLDELPRALKKATLMLAPLATA
jgi:arginine/lysine/ornithine decarboxylase